MKSNYRRIWDFIQQINIRNKDLKVSNLLWINIDKFFMPSVANIVWTDMSKYKIVKKWQFACNRMHVWRDERVPVALSKSNDEFIVSPAYNVFEIIDESKLLPEYLMMWFSRREFDRNAWFYTDADIRQWLHRDAFCDMKLPVPDIQKQQKIVDEYNVIKNRILLNNDLIEKLEDTAQAIYREWFVDFEFPDENGQPYKASNGEMVYCEELEKDVPIGWKVESLVEVSKIKAWWDKPNNFSLRKTKEYFVPIFSNWVINEWLYWYTNKANYPNSSITISARWTIWYSVLRHEKFDAIVRLLVIIPNKDYYWIYLWQAIKNFNFYDSWSVQKQLTIPQISIKKILMPTKNIIQKYDKILKIIYNHSYKEKKENESLWKMKELLLSRMVSF